MDSYCIIDKDIADEQLAQAAAFFSANYGVWSESAVINMGPSIEAGARVKISPRLLKDKILPRCCDNVFIRSFRNNELVGTLFATRWIHNGKRIAWVTQLCVHRDHRHKGIATGLLNDLKTESKRDAYYAVGILSSHPFSIKAVARVFGRGLKHVDLETMRSEARKVVASSPVMYVRDAVLKGALYEDFPTKRVVSCADTQFWVDHGERCAALRTLKKEKIPWPLGWLPEGHEYLLLVKVMGSGNS